MNGPLRWAALAMHCSQTLEWLRRMADCTSFLRFCQSLLFVLKVPFKWACALLLSSAKPLDTLQECLCEPAGGTHALQPLQQDHHHNTRCQQVACAKATNQPRYQNSTTRQTGRALQPQGLIQL